ncbi:MAG: patatin-like phospholipase family protein [Candidatus Sumerlaeaceae bacterium]
MTHERLAAIEFSVNKQANVCFLSCVKFYRFRAVLCGLVLTLSAIIAVAGEPRYSPVSEASRMVARREANAPLQPGRERVDLPLHPVQRNGPLVLLSISGGGSRAAYYAACAMEQLSKIPSPSGHGSILDEVRVISGISAGSLAAAWFTLHYHERHDPDFFPRFKVAMATNLQWRTYGHMVVFPPLALELFATPITRTDLLANEMEHLLGAGPVTFDDLRRLESDPNDPAPILILNGTALNSGQRFVMTNLPAERFPSLLPLVGPRVALSLTDQAILRRLVQPLTFEDIGSDIGSFRVARAVAASAAYPIALAPLRLNIYPESIPEPRRDRTDEALKESKYLYVADGGVYENQGIDPLLSLVRTLPRSQPVFLIVIDGSQRMETVRVTGHKIWDPFSVIRKLYDIGTLRPLAFYGSALKDIHDPEAFQGVFIRMEGYEPGMDEFLQSIPTLFKLSRRHREALDQAAAENVARMRKTLERNYRRLLRR